MVVYPVVPVPAPRQVRSDSWRPRLSVVRYRAFRDQVRLLGIRSLPDFPLLIFGIEMPKSWSAKRKDELHLAEAETGRRGDLDNYVKAFLDSVYPDDDRHVTKFCAFLVHARKGFIAVDDLEDGMIYLWTGRLKAAMEEER